MMALPIRRVPEDCKSPWQPHLWLPGTCRPNSHLAACRQPATVDVQAPTCGCLVLACQRLRQHLNGGCIIGLLSCPHTLQGNPLTPCLHVSQKLPDVSGWQVVARPVVREADDHTACRRKQVSGKQVTPAAGDQGGAEVVLLQQHR